MIKNEKFTHFDYKMWKFTHFDYKKIFEGHIIGIKPYKKSINDERVDIE